MKVLKLDSDRKVSVCKYFLICIYYLFKFILLVKFEIGDSSLVKIESELMDHIYSHQKSSSKGVSRETEIVEKSESKESNGVDPLTVYYISVITVVVNIIFSYLCSKMSYRSYRNRYQVI